MENVPPYLLGVVVGIVLSDGHLQLFKGRVNARLQFVQSIGHLGFFTYAFWLLAPICMSLPYITFSIRDGVILGLLHLSTRALPFLTELHKLFYAEDGIKRLPAGEIMFNLLSPIALAFWIMGDGGFKGPGVMLCTDSFTVKDTVMLMNVLTVRYGLECTLFMQQNRENRHPRIYIKGSSVPRLRAIVLPYMHSSMLYKFGPTH